MESRLDDQAGAVSPLTPDFSHCTDGILRSSSPTDCSRSCLVTLRFISTIARIHRCLGEVTALIFDSNSGSAGIQRLLRSAFRNDALASGVRLHHPGVVSGLPFAGSPCSGSATLNVSCSPAATTSSVSPCLVFPRRSFSASGSCRYFSTARRIGRAP